jgi:hypothetical protein
VAIADAPIIGTLVRQSGLEAVADRVVGLSGTSWAEGVTVSLQAGYADVARTAIALRVEPTARLDPTAITMVDQFGHAYSVRGMVGDMSTGEYVVLFAPLDQPAEILGARLSITIDSVIQPNGER